jgi:hypothetical protein
MSFTYDKFGEKWKAEVSGKQLTLLETQIRFKEKVKLREDIIHDSVRAAAFSGQSLHIFEWYFGSLLKKYCPSAKTIPSYKHLRTHYLNNVYESHYFNNVYESHYTKIKEK